MKHFIYFTFILSMMNICFGCKKDPCDGIECQNGGYCADGGCNCPEGFEGERCETLIAYTCDNGTCRKATDADTPEFTDYYVCQSLCGKKDQGYNCENGNCKYTSDNPTYGTLSICQNSCTQQTTCSLSKGTITKSILLNALSIYTSYTSDPTSITEAENIAKYLCNDAQIKFLNSNSVVCAELPNGYHIAIFPNTYNKPFVYGIRFAIDDSHSFFGSNASYFEFEKPGVGGGNDCFSSPYYGAQNCSANNVAVSPNLCCPSSFPYFGIEKNGCYNTCLDAKSDGNSTIVFGTGKTNGSGGNGQIIFYISKDHNCGNITVNLAGIQQTISKYYTSGSPDCDDSGSATFSLLPGKYTFDAKCNGYTWGPSTVTITENYCNKFKLN